MTILTVLAAGHTLDDVAQAERFLSAGARSMSLLGVAARTRVRTGPVVEQILDEFGAGNFDLLVIGAPLPDRRGSVTLGGFVGELVAKSNERPVLIVRTH